MIQFEKCPILIIAFKRPHFLQARIEELLPLGARIYVHIDKAKNGSQDAPANQETIEVGMRYENEIYALKVSDSSQGLRQGVIRAITWYFQHESVGIILEDDIEINSKFYSYANEKLREHRLNQYISSISSSRFNFNNAIMEREYLSIFSSSWGWATWKDRWDFFLESQDKFPKSVIKLKKMNLDFSSRFFWQLIFFEVRIGKIDTWDYIWLWHNMYFSKFALVPPRNLSINHGFGVDGTHTTFDKPTWLYEKITDLKEFGKHEFEEMEVPEDRWINRHIHGITPWNLLKHIAGNFWAYIVIMVSPKK